MKELLRITMSEAQVKEACKEFAEARASITEPCAISVEFPSVRGERDPMAEVVFTKKRVRTQKISQPGGEGSSNASAAAPTTQEQ